MFLFPIKKAGLLASLSILALLSCNTETSNDAQPDKEQTVVKKEVAVPRFNSDNAYNAIVEQVAFGPRVPGSKAQQDCARYLTERLKALCDTVYVQQTTVKGGDGKTLPCINIIGAVNPQASRRFLLLAHWDSRPWADNDVTDRDKPIDAADDGASGVAVLLEIARVLKENPIPGAVGIDILFVDVEDYGKTEWGDDSYCLGTQYWAKNPHVPGYKAELGILLDMVGSKNARFPMEAGSAYFAPQVQKKVWAAAHKAGFSSYFLYQDGGGVTDDHIYVNRLAGIPTIDIINLSDNPQSVFGPHWHTHKDNIDNIDKATLNAVGQSLLQFIYDETAE